MSFAPTTTRLRLGIPLAIVSLWIPCLARSETTTQPPQIRTEMVLQIGKAQISRYAVDKNFANFRRKGPGADDRTPADTARWFELYLARQVMIAEALNLGYAERPEVIRVVESMTRHMLAQADIPLPPPAPADLYAAYEAVQAPPGQTKPAFDTLRPTLEQSITQRQRLEQKRIRRERMLREAELVINPAIAEALLREIQSGPPIERDIPGSRVASLAQASLGTYRRGDEAVTITVEAWRDYFNRLFVRALPEFLPHLLASIEDCVVLDLAGRETRQRGVDREPRFVEDQRNFVYYQALDLFEKEHLRPLITINPVEVEAYYRDHPAEFSKPVRAHGQLLRFRDAAAAVAWMQNRQAEVTAVETVLVSQVSPIPSIERATDRLLRGEVGKPVGPIRTVSDVVIFVPKTIETKPLAFSEVADAIREKLTLPRMEELEMRLAREWASRYLIEDHLHLEEFAIPETIRKPWAAVN